MPDLIAINIDRSDTLLNEASDLSTPSDRLQAISRHTSQEDILKALAKNPNTPETLLYTLWETYPEAFLENPIIELWLFTGAPSIEEKLPAGATLCIYMHLIDKGVFSENRFFFPDKARERFSSQFYNDLFATYQRIDNKPWDKYATQIEFYLAKDPNECIREITAARTRNTQVLNQLSKDADENVRQHIAKNRAIPTNAHKSMALDPSENVRLQLAQNTNVNPISAGFRSLASAEEINIRIAVAANPIAPSAVLHLLASDAEKNVRSAVAQNDSIDSKTSHKLLGDENEVVSLLAQNHSACPHALGRLVHHKSSRVRQTLASNRILKFRQKMELLDDDSCGVRNAIAIHYGGGSKAFWDKGLSVVSATVRETLAGRSWVPRDVLLKLAKDPSNKVRRRLTARLRDRLFQHNTETNRKLVDLLAQDADPGIRAEILKDFRTSNERLATLVSDPEKKVRLSLAKRYLSLESGLLGDLAIDSCPSVRLAAARNLLGFGHDWGTTNQTVDIWLFRSLQYLETILSLQTKDECLAIRLNLAESSATPVKNLNELIDDKSERVRKALLRRPTFPKDIYLNLVRRPWARKLFGHDRKLRLTLNLLRRTSESDNAYVRSMTARNSLTPMSILRKLANDRCWLVRAQLAQNPRCPVDLLKHLAGDKETLVRHTAENILKGRNK